LECAGKGVHSIMLKVSGYMYMYRQDRASFPGSSVIFSHVSMM